MGVPDSRQLVAFGVFELDVRAQQLRRSDRVIRVAPQPLQLLAVLLERPGEVFTRAELRARLWPSDVFVDFDRSLNKAIRGIRDALGDAADAPRYVETLPRVGYRFIAPVSITPAPLSWPRPQNDRVPVPDPVRTRISERRISWRALFAASVCLVAIGETWSLTHSAPTGVVRAKQLSHSSGPKRGNLVTDGRSVFFSEQTDGRLVPMQLSVEGGDAIPLPVTLENALLEDVSRDGSGLLVTSPTAVHGEQEPSLWIISPSNGSVRRAGDLSAQSAAWSPDASQIVYASRNDLFVADASGTRIDRIATLPSPARRLRWSPDGGVIRFDVAEPGGGSSIWEVSPRGSRLRQVLSGWNHPARERSGAWTPDGQSYVFESTQDGVSNLWSLDERRGLLPFAPRPVQLTFGPMDLSQPTPGRVGSTIFAIGRRAQGELVQYDAASQQFVPFLSGISAEGVAPSRDGRWIAYVRFPEGTLWRSRVDGTAPLQLTWPPIRAGVPQWSPDGRTIAFSAHVPNEGTKLYIVPSDGGTPRQLLRTVPSQHEFSPFWSPDGMKLIYGGYPADQAELEKGIRSYELTTGTVATVPGSRGMCCGVWSWDGRFILAEAPAPVRLMLYDVRRHTWSELYRGLVNYFDFSHDGNYVYFDTDRVESPAIYRISTSDRSIARIAGLRGISRTVGAFGAWFDLGPDDALLLMRNISSEQIYSLDWRRSR